MSEDINDYKKSIDKALDNAKKRIKLVDYSDRNCLLEEYKEWINQEFNYQTVLILREDPMI